MERDGYHLDHFYNSMIRYFNEVLIHKNCVSSTFRKYNVKSEEDVEFSFLLKSPIGSSCEDKKFFKPIESSYLTEEEVNRLKIISESWCLHLADVAIRESKLCLKLNRPHTFLTVITTILHLKSNYGESIANKKITIKLTCDETKVLYLTEYRTNLIKTTYENLLRYGGYELCTEKEQKWINFTTKNNYKTEETKRKFNIVCGPVINAQTKAKETKIFSNDYVTLYSRNLKEKFQDKYSDDEKNLELLTDTCIKVSLLQTKSNQRVILNFNPDWEKARESGSKGGVFIQYNSSRLFAIRKKYEQSVINKIYPEMSKPEEVDFSVLQEPEEWCLLFNFLLEYPLTIEKISREITEGKSNIHQLCDFLLKLCGLFSIYYRRVRILLEPKNHLLQIIQARILLVMSVEQVLENGLNVLNIKRITEM